VSDASAAPPSLRRLALLAVLAAAGARGRSRDQLLALFWPEATQSRARHSLDQLLYVLRGSLDDSLFVSGDPVRLNTAVLASDVEARLRAAAGVLRRRRGGDRRGVPAVREVHAGRVRALAGSPRSVSAAAWRARPLA